MRIHFNEWHGFTLRIRLQRKKKRLYKETSSCPARAGRPRQFDYENYESS